MPGADGSFKLRGALNKLRTVAPGSAGVVAGSAGNHAQAVAYAARRHGVACEVFMPVDAAVSKLAAVRAFGATNHQEGQSVDECVALARERARERRLTFIHPFDHEEVIAGRASGSSSPATCPTFARSSCRSAVAASPPGSRSRSSSVAELGGDASSAQ